jgi:phenylalanyl-tRNA synthetase beta chain
MKLSLNWLKNYIDPKLSTEKLIERLTMAGLEVETVAANGADTVLELEITPNRPDCLSILGLAREIAAITGKSVKFPKAKIFKTPALKDLVSIENKKECSRYIGTLIRDVQIKSAPQEITKLLEAMGIHRINNAVDVTNFVLMETGQPLHAFDYDKLAGGKVIVRRARAGESIVTLDGVERKLDKSILVIADTEKPVAIAGIMGGLGTEITAGTKNILLESAHFDMGLIRQACRSLGLRSDSSYRFERHVNLDGVATGANRAIDLLLPLTGGRLSGRCEIGAKASKQSVKIQIKIADIESLLGLKITSAQLKSWLDKLGFKVTIKAGGLTVVPPANRIDIAQGVDVIEEVARMIGFDHLPLKMPVIKSANISVNKRPREINDQIRKVLAAEGMDEIITHSMINSRALAKCNMTHLKAVRIFNPLNQDQELMRPSMLPSMLQAAVTNINRGQKDLRLFEIGKRYLIEGEKESLGVVWTGRRSYDWRSSRKDTVEFFDLKGTVERLFQNIGLSPAYESNQFPVLDNSCAASITLNGHYLGSFGKVDRQILNNWDIKNQDVYFAGIHLSDIYPLPGRHVKFQSISEFPAIVRDVSLAVKKEIPYQKIEDTCKAQGGDILRSVQFLEQYIGDKIPAGFKGLFFSCLYQSNDRTLREEEVSAVHERIVQALIKDLNAIRR